MRTVRPAAFKHTCPLRLASHQHHPPLGWWVPSCLSCSRTRLLYSTSISLPLFRQNWSKEFSVLLAPLLPPFLLSLPLCLSSNPDSAVWYAEVRGQRLSSHGLFCDSVLLCYFCLFLFTLRESTRRAEEGQRERESHAGSALSVQSPAWGSISRTVRS